MHQGRLRLRPWLEEQIRSGNYPGVTWLDETAGVFQIPWKHAARHGWNIDKDATLFRNWAMHTGRYKPGVDKPDPKTWKANFRCALNSLPDVKELHDRSIKKGNNAFRVYMLLPSVKGAKRRKGPRVSDSDIRCTGTEFFSHTVQSGVCPSLELFPDSYCRYRDSDSGYSEGMMDHRDSPMTGVTTEKAQDYFSTHSSSVPSALNGNMHSSVGANEHTQAVLKIVEHLKNMESWDPPHNSTKNWSGFYGEGMDYSAPFQADYHMYGGQQRPYFHSQ